MYHLFYHSCSFQVKIPGVEIRSRAVAAAVEAATIAEETGDAVAETKDVAEGEEEVEAADLTG